METIKNTTAINIRVKVFMFCFTIGFWTGITLGIAKHIG